MTNPNAHNWREIGDTTLEVYQAEFARVKSPIAPVASVFNVSKPHSALILAQMWIENQYATTGILITPDMRNPLGLRPRNYPEEIGGKNGFAIFASWEDCIRAWHRRVNDGSLPYPNSVTLAQFLAIYAPSGDVHPITGVDNADIQYEKGVRTMLARFAQNEGPITPPSPPTPPSLTKLTDLIPNSTVTFGWQAKATRPLYNYAPQYGFPADRHTGVDVGAPYGTPVYAPRAGVVKCVGTGKGKGVDGGPCSSFADTGDLGPEGPSLGAGRVELELDNGMVWIAGHARTATKPLGATVKAGEQVATVGGMYGPHIHFEARVRDGGTSSGWRLVDPATVFSSGGTEMQFGRVPHPPFENRPIQKAEGRGQNNLGKRNPKGVCLHRMVGTLMGTDGWFRRPDVNGLTDYGVGVLATDGAASDGRVLKWNDPLGFQSGWASGPWQNPPGPGRALVQKYGVNVINRDLVSIEISGQYATAFSAKAFEAVARIIAYWADYARIPWNQFPTNPHTGLTFVYEHSNFQNHKACCGQVVRAAIPSLINRAREIMRQYQTGQATPQYAQPSVVPGFDGTKNVTVNDAVFFADKRTVRVSADSLNRRQYATVNSQQTGPPILKDTAFNVLGWVVGERVSGEDRWWIGDSYSRLWAGGTYEKPRAQNTPPQPPPPTPPPPPPPMPPPPDPEPPKPEPPKPEPPKDENPRIINGVRFYKTARMVTLNQDYDLQRWATHDSESVEAGDKGDMFPAAYWVLSEAKDGEAIWWVIDDIDGARLWAGATEERPE